MEIISIQDARARGLSRYFTGVPCRNGHVSERFVTNRTCVSCNFASRAEWGDKNMASLLEKQSQWRRDNPERAREIEARKYQKHALKILERVAKWRRNNLPKFNAIQAKRRARKLRATPRWMTPEHFAQIAAIYAEAQRLTDETGILHHVDHIVPLQGKLVCGLHVPWNLQAIPANDNLKKSNKHAA